MPPAHSSTNSSRPSLNSNPDKRHLTNNLQ